MNGELGDLNRPKDTIQVVVDIAEIPDSYAPRNKTMTLVEMSALRKKLEKSSFCGEFEIR